MASLYQILLLLTYELLFMLSIIVTNSNATKSIGASSMLKRVVAKLIHLNSVRSPFYDPNHTDIHRAKFALGNSVARFAIIEQKMKSNGWL